MTILTSRTCQGIVVLLLALAPLLHSAEELRTETVGKNLRVLRGAVTTA